MCQEEIGRSKMTRGSSQSWRKGDDKGKIVSEGIAQVIDGMDNPFLVSTLFGEARVLGVHENGNATVRLNMFCQHGKVPYAGLTRFR